MAIKPIKMPISALDKFSTVLSSFEARVERLSKPIKKIGGGAKAVFGTIAKFGAVGAGLGVGLFALSKKTAELSSDLYHTSDRLGFSVVGLQEYRYAAGQSNITTETFDNSMQRLGKTAADASAGVESAAGLFRALGINVKDGAGNLKTTEALFGDVSVALQKIKNPLIRNRAAFQLFGRDGVKMVQLTKEGVEGIAKLRQEAHRFGVVTEEQAKAGTEFGDNIDRMSMSLLGVRNVIGNAVMPAFNTLILRATALFVDKKPQIEAFAKVFAEKLPGYIEQTVQAVKTLAGVIGPIASLLLKVAANAGPVKTGILLIGLASLKAMGPINLIIGALQAMNFLVKKLALSSAATPINNFLQAFGLTSGSGVALAIAGVAAFGVAVGVTTGHIRNLLKEHKHLEEMKNRFGRGPAEITTQEKVVNRKIRQLQSLYLKNAQGQPYTEEDYNTQKALEKELSASVGVDFSGDFQSKIRNLQQAYDSRVGGVDNYAWRHLQAPGAPVTTKSEVSVTLTLPNAPRGTKVSVSPTDIPIDVNMGQAFAP